MRISISPVHSVLSWRLQGKFFLCGSSPRVTNVKVFLLIALAFCKIL
jgi:hypothetical protein